MSNLVIEALGAEPRTLAQLSPMLIEVVAGGGSVGFMHPLASDAALSFLTQSLSAAARGERVILGAWDEGTLAGTVTLLLACPPNQPHRAEIAKLMTRVDRRGRGIAAALMRAAEALAIERGKTLLVLDTASEGGARGLYQGLGFTLAGEIPGYAFKPQGGLSGTLIYWKRIGGVAQLKENLDSGPGTAMLQSL